MRIERCEIRKTDVEDLAASYIALPEAFVVDHSNDKRIAVFGGTAKECREWIGERIGTGAIDRQEESPPSLGQRSFLGRWAYKTDGEDTVTVESPIFAECKRIGIGGRLMLTEGPGTPRTVYEIRAITDSSVEVEVMDHEPC